MRLLLVIPITVWSKMFCFPRYSDPHDGNKERTKNNQSREVSLPGAVIKDVTEGLINIIKSTDYYSFPIPHPWNRKDLENNIKRLWTTRRESQRNECLAGVLTPSEDMQDF